MVIKKFCRQRNALVSGANLVTCVIGVKPGKTRVKKLRLVGFDKRKFVSSLLVKTTSLSKSNIFNS